MIKINKKIIEIPIDLFKNILSEPIIEFNDGIKIVSHDDANVCMCIFELNKNKFVNYELEKPEKFKINMEMFDKVIKRIKTENILFKFKNEQFIILDDKNKKQFGISIMEDEETKKEIPQIEYTSSFKMKSKDFSELIIDASMVGDSCKIETTEEKLLISAGDLNKYNSEIDDIIINNSASAKFSLEYLQKFMNASKYFDDVFFEFSNDSPCRLTFENEDLKIQFILAPRISDD